MHACLERTYTAIILGNYTQMPPLQDCLIPNLLEMLAATTGTTSMPSEFVCTVTACAHSCAGVVVMPS